MRCSSTGRYSNLSTHDALTPPSKRGRPSSRKPSIGGHTRVDAEQPTVRVTPFMHQRYPTQGDDGVGAGGEMPAHASTGRVFCSYRATGAVVWTLATLGMRIGWDGLVTAQKPATTFGTKSSNRGRGRGMRRKPVKKDGGAPCGDEWHLASACPHERVWRELGTWLLGDDLGWL